MDAEQLKTLRAQMGLSQAELGELLRLGKNGGRTVRRWEAGTPIPGPATVAIDALVTGWRPGLSTVFVVRQLGQDFSYFLQHAAQLIEQSGNELQLVLSLTRKQE